MERLHSGQHFPGGTELRAIHSHVLSACLGLGLVLGSSDTGTRDVIPAQGVMSGVSIHHWADDNNQRQHSG